MDCFRPPGKSRNFAQHIRVEEPASEHDEASVAQIAQALWRVTLEQRQISNLADADRAGVLLLSNQLRGKDRGRGQCLGGRYAGLLATVKAQRMG